MLYSPRKKITFVLFEDQRTSRSFEFSKFQIKVIISILVVTFFSLLGLSLYLLTNIQNVKEEISRQEPILIKALRKKEKDLSEKLSRLESLNQEYLEKISTTKLESDALLPLFSPTLGFKDLTSQKILNVENISVSRANDRVNFDFNIVNNQSENSKISGFIFVLMKSGSQLYLYPEREFLFDNALSTFNQGETFTISRFRKVDGYFKDTNFQSNQGYFKIFIFNRTGDLIHKQSIGPIEI